MAYYLSPLAWLFNAYEMAKGPRTLQQLYTPQPHSDGYKVVFSDGSIISIFCHEVVYYVNYAAWWASGKRIYIYWVYCTFSHDVPKDLKERFSKEFRITNVLHLFATRAERKKAAIDAYVDLMIDASY